jgi:hypothetical protein
MKQSIVIRGSISYERHPENYLNSVIGSIRSWFDGQIILSTWKEQEKYLDKFLEIDEVIFTEDPGSGPIQQWKRQVVSYQKGLEKATGDLVMVTRSDIAYHKNLFKYVDTFPNSTTDLKVFDKKLVISNMMTIRPDYDEIPNCFRVCDWIQIGYKNDIYKWSDVLEHVDSLDLSKITNMNCTESLWFLSVLKNKFGKLIDIYDSSNINNSAWEAIVNNFIVMDTRTSLNAENLNWKFLPEYGSCYFSESLYEQLYESIIE